MTDGYEAAVDDYALFTPAELMAAAQTDIRAPLDAARAVEAADPACVRFPRFKPSDDATAILVRYREGVHRGGDDG